MCAIIYLPAGKSLLKTHLTNCVYNNAHGFGIVTNVDGQLDVFRHFDEKGNDPELVEEELKKRENLDRYLHLRYATVGDKDLKNTHPFTVYEGPDNHKIVFMHNGSIYEFKSKDDTSISDTRAFAEKFLTPFLQKFHGDNGVADIEDNMMDFVLSKFFSTSTNRGLLISNKLDPLYLGTWTSFESNGEKFLVSNSDYFTNVTESRMTPHFKELRAKDRTFHSPSANATATAASSNSGGYPRLAYDEQKAKEAGTSEATITLLKEIDLSAVTRFLVPADIEPLVGDINDLTTEFLPTFNYLTSTEILRFVEDKPREATRLIEWLSYTCNILDEDLRVAVEKKDKGEKHIATTQTRINSQITVINSQGRTIEELKATIENKDREIRELENKLDALVGKLNQKSKVA